jgi:hypothetical protein
LQLLGTGPSGTDLTSLARFQAATVAGMASGLIATPSELIIIQQQVRVHTWMRVCMFVCVCVFIIGGSI